MIRDRFYIGGTWTVPSCGDTIAVLDPTTEEVIGSVPSGTAEDADQAIRAARGAFEQWSRTPPSERARYTSQIAEALGARMVEISRLIAHEVGTPVNISTIIQVGLPITTFASMAELVGQFRWEETIANSMVVREPVGVVGAITPWNYPLHQIAAKVAPALAAGCTVVLKPSKVAPLNAFVLAEVIHEVGLPPGVFNLVSGRARCRRGHGPSPGARHGVLHRVDPCRDTGRGACRRNGQESDPRARWQVRCRNTAGRGPGSGGVGGGDDVFPELRPDL